MRLSSSFATLGLLLGLALLGPAGAQDANLVVEDDWLSVQGARSKVFLPGSWSYEALPSDIGTQVTAKGSSGKLQLTLQSIEGKQEATPERLQAIFEGSIVPGAVRSAEPDGEGRLKARYAVNVDGENAVFKALFVRHEGTGYMVYLHALAEDAAADPGLEKLMDSVLRSFQPL
jgi:hypothetical protein